METASKRPTFAFVKIIGPGILVAATGIGAGDLATGAFTGTTLGVAILWAVVIGAFLKYVLNEGLARWQLATGETLLEGAVHRLGNVVPYVFLPYLLLWSVFVGSALMSACGATMHAAVPIFAEAGTGKIVFGILHSLLGVALVLIGGFKLFEKIMSVCIGVMFVVVIVTASLICSDWGAVAQGLVVPTIPQFFGDGLNWTIALMGGVGGTLTVLCYGYWIREKGRQGEGDLKTCRMDLGVAYVATAIFGLAMVIIGSQIDLPEDKGKGAKLIVILADKLSETRLGSVGKWTFLIGAWGAVFSSLLGVWQAVPYIFADFCGLVKEKRAADGGSPSQPIDVDTRGWAYRGYLLGIAIVPMLGLFVDFTKVQKLYAIFGALFMPMLAVTLLLLNSKRKKWVEERMSNRPFVSVVLALTVIVFVVYGYLKAQTGLGMIGGWLSAAL